MSAFHDAVSKLLVPRVVHVSGGRTSAYMAVNHMPSRAVCTFQNTGLEHPKTYEFLRRVEDHVKHEIIWLEWRPGPRADGPTNEWMFAVVRPETATYGPDLMAGMLRAFNAYRAARGMKPEAPWARQRLCTGFLKYKVARRYMLMSGYDEWDAYIGLRADEPSRVVGLRNQETRRQAFKFPLFDAGVTKADVEQFWARMPFDLEILPHQGNCTACFLKNEADLARLLDEPETQAEVWQALQREFPGFGGQNRLSYEALHAELPLRMEAEGMLRRGEDPLSLAPDRGRRRLVVLQERRRFAEGAGAFSCSCETSMVGDDE